MGKADGGSQSSKEGRLDIALKFLQIVSIVAVAIWTVYVFWGVDKAQRDLTQKQAEINTKQLELLAPIERDLKGFERDKAQTEAAIRSETNTHPAVVPKSILEIGCSRFGPQFVTYELALTNSTPQRVELSWTAFVRFLGSKTQSVRFDQLDDMNEPALKAYKESDNGPIEWKSAGSTWHGVADPNLAEKFRSDISNVKTTGNPVKIMQPGATDTIKATYYLQPKRTKFVAIIGIYAINGGHRGENVYLIKNIKPIVPCGKESAGDNSEPKSE